MFLICSYLFTNLSLVVLKKFFLIQKSFFIQLLKYANFGLIEKIIKACVHYFLYFTKRKSLIMANAFYFF